MTARPWVTPSEVKAYSENPKVQQRSDDRLSMDIARAESYVITATHNNFSAYENIPDDVKRAIILLAEHYAISAIQTSSMYQSETFDDYSYTAKSSESSIDSLGISALLTDYIISEPKNGVTMRLRKL